MIIEVVLFCVALVADAVAWYSIWRTRVRRELIPSGQEDRSEPSEPTMPIALAAALMAADEKDQVRARMAMLGANGVLAWDGGDSIAPAEVKARLLAPAHALAPGEREWLDEAFTEVEVGAMGRWKGTESLLHAHDRFTETVDAELARQELVDPRAKPIEQAWGRRAVAAAGVGVGMLALAAYWVGDAASLLISSGLFGMLQLGTFVAAAVNLRYARRRTHGNPAPTGRRRLTELASVRSLIDQVLHKGFPITSDLAQRLLPWAILFGQGDEWHAMLVERFGPPSWLEAYADESPEQRFTNFCVNIAIVSLPDPARRRG